MKKKLMHFATILLALIMLPLSAGAAGAPMNNRVRIGLAYGSSAAPGANLLNSVGSGYRLGYFNDDLSFVELGRTAETGISIVKAQNVWYGSIPGSTLKGYSDNISSQIAVGCYHIQLPTTYGSFSEASIAAAAIPDGFPAWINGAYYVRIGSYLTSDSAQTALGALGIVGASVEGTSSAGVSVVKTGTASIIFQFDGGTALSLGVRPGLDDTQICATWFAGNKYYGDFRYQRFSGGNLTVVNILDREDYINCVISQEMSASWPLEALKAQALCARTYAAACVGKHSSYGFDLCATTDCQAYPGMGRIGVNTIRAAAETAGQYIWYRGALAQTYYFSSDGGATENVRNVWGGNTDLPYLAGVVDPWEAAVESKISGYRWSYTFTKEELAAKLRASGRNCGTLADVRISETTATGNVRSITFTDTAGASWTIAGGDKCRIFLGVKSVRFSVASSGSGSGSYYINEGGNMISTPAGAYAIDGSGNMIQLGGESPYVITGSGIEQLAPSISGGDSFTFSGSGWGHNVGMSQWGAYSMAQQGKSCTDIIKFYFTGVDIY